MQIDVRKQDDKVDNIVFHEIKYTEDEPCVLSKDDDGIKIVSGYGDSMYLISNYQVKYLIKALEKSIELGWFQE